MLALILFYSWPSSSIKDAGVLEVSDMVVPADTDVNQGLMIF